MAQALGILAIAGVIVALELPALRKKQLKRELWTFSSLLALATVLNIIEAMNIELPNPVSAIAFVVQPLSNLLEMIFH